MKVHNFCNGPQWDESLQRWICDIRLPNRKRIKRRFRRERQAQAWWKTTTRQIDDGTWNRVQAPTDFGHAVDEYRQSIQVTIRSPKSYESALRFWEAHLGRTTPLSSISTMAIEAGLAKRQVEVTPSTLNQAIVVIRRVFSWLQRRYPNTNNPAQELRLVRVNNERVVYLEPEQFKRLLESCKNSKWWFFPSVVIVAAGTGMRKSNVLNLKISEVDFTAKVIRVTKTKSQKTVTIPIIDVVFNVLQNLAEVNRDSVYFFPRGKGVNPSMPVHFIYREWIRAVKDCGIAAEFERAGKPPFRFHDLRHCFASWLALDGVHTDVVGLLLGHADSRMARRYAHLSPDYLRKETTRLNEMFSKTFPKPTTILGCREQADATHSNIQISLNFGEETS